MLLISCYHEVDMDSYRDEDGENLLTLNSLVTPDSTVQVMATRTYFFSDIHNDRTYVKGLDIDIIVNSEKKEGMTYVTVSRQGPVSIYTNSDFVFTYRVTFTDPIGDGDYYFLQWDAVDPRKDIMMGERDFTHELVFQQLANQVHATLPGWEPYSPYGLPFSDKGIDGERYTTTIWSALS